MEIPKIYQNKSVPELLKISEKHFNAYIRARDSKDGYFKCISCGKVKDTDKMHAGHFMPKTYSATRFNTDNVNGQCAACNTHKHGNLILYRQNLIQKIGEEKVAWVEAIARTRVKWDRYTLISIILEFKQKIKEL